MFTNPPDETMRRLLTESRRIAVVGISPHRHRPSFRIARFLVQSGYEVIGVRPDAVPVLDLPCYPNLLDIPGGVDIVNVFRRPQAVATHVEEVLTIGAPALWLQLGVIDDDAALKAERSGVVVVMDRCILIEHARLLS